MDHCKSSLKEDNVRCSQDGAKRYLPAPNVEVKKSADGSIKYISASVKRG